MWEDYQAQMTWILFVVLCLLPVYAKDCSVDVSFILRKDEIFNSSNFGTVCLDRTDGYGKHVVVCGGHILNPKCICAYDMYEKGINDICKEKASAENSNGSLKHITVEFCKKHSYEGNGPCQNGGQLIETKELAIDAKCKCKEGYHGDFCDTVNKSIVCVPVQNPGPFPDCTKQFVYSGRNTRCLLSLEAGYTFLCDANTTAKDEMEACTSAPEQFRGDSSKGLTTHTPDIVSTFTTLLLLIVRSSIV
ncbi:uncharacterized protein LOC111103809 [Crassostrea virginica]